MFLSVQFPLADLRHFVTESTGRLTAPPWPLVDVRRHFIRSVGAVQKRRRGGIEPWLGEDRCCDARGVLKFAHEDGEPIRGTAGGTVLKPVFRRYFAGGYPSCPGAVSRFDLGFSVGRNPPNESNPSKRPVKAGKELIRSAARSALSVPVRVPERRQVDDPIPSIVDRPRALGTAGTALARRLLDVTTSLQVPPARLEPWWITSGTPLVLIEASSEDDALADLNELGRAKEGEWPTAEAPMIAQYFQHVDLHANRIPVWLLISDPEVDREVLRNLRLHLWRLHNEREVLRTVLGFCLERKLFLAKSEPLRDYVARQSDRLRKTSAGRLPQRQLLEFAYGLDRVTNRDDLRSLKEVLDEVESPGLTASVMPIAAALPARSSPPGAYNINVQADKDTYLIFTEGGAMVTGENAQNVQNSSVGAVVGGQANVSGGNFLGSGTQSNDGATAIDLKSLAAELEQLRSTLRSQANQLDHDIAIAEVARAEQAAKDGDASAARSALARAGEWVLDVAKAIGVPLVLEVLKQGGNGS